MTVKTVFIPFCGFYESWIDDLIDNEIEMAEIDNYTVDFDGIAREYAILYNDALYERLEEEEALQYMPDLTFDRLISPREYNFETDRIMVSFTTPRYNLRKIYEILTGNDDALDRDIQQTFASRSGFASFYDDFAQGWRSKPLLEWDSNELSVLLPVFDFVDLDLDAFRETLSDYVQERQAA